jgi:hypothetical protein
MMVDLTDADIVNVIKAERQDERECCAKIAETWRSPYGGPRDLEVAQAIAAAIRAANQ